jgi:hypothetical protein
MRPLETRRSTLALIGVLSALAGGCAGARPEPEGSAIFEEPGFLGVKAAVVGAASGPVDSGLGASATLTRLYGALAVVGEAMSLRLDDRSELLQSRLYAKLNLPIYPGRDVTVALGPLVGLAYTDAVDAPGWSLDHAALMSGVDGTLAFWGRGDAGVIANVRWSYVEWDLSRPGGADKQYSALEFCLGMVWRF